MQIAHPSLARLASDLAAGVCTARELTEDCLARIADPVGEGARAFTQVDAEVARRSADTMDALRSRGCAPSPLAGIPISVKDLFDLEGQVTHAGSRALADRAPARADAPAVASLRRAGLVILGRTQMPEFALSGLGLNAQSGTPRAPWGRAEGRAPGGSSSGAAVSVADGMAHAALGSDTGGSCRIPAAWCGVVGFKPTASAVSRAGMVPLSSSLDSVGPLARTVACCAALFDLMRLPQPSGAPRSPRRVRALSELRLGLPQTLVLDQLDAEVARCFEASVAALARSGVTLVDLPMHAFRTVAAMHQRGSIVAAESYAWHRPLLSEKAALYDPRVRERIERGAAMSAADYASLQTARRDFIRSVAQEAGGVDALLMPTCAGLPPRLTDLRDDDAFARANVMALRNAAVVNLFDGCAMSLPRPAPSGAPCGLTLAALHGQDDQLIECALAVEAALGDS